MNSIALAALALLGWQEPADTAPGFPTEVFNTLLPSGANRKPGDVRSQGLAGTAVGLVIWPRQVTAGPHRDGLSWFGLGAGCYFSIEGDPYLYVQFEATDEEERRQQAERVWYVFEDRKIPVASGPEKVRTYPRLSSCPSVYERLKAQGYLPGPICLVEVEVNDGFGSPKGAESFVVTRVKTVEGGPEFALKAVDALEESKRCHEETLASLTEEIETLIAPLRKDLMARFEEMPKKAARGRPGPYGVNTDRFPVALTGDRSTEAAYYYATWLPERELLQVNWLTRRIEGACATGLWHDGHSEVPPLQLVWGVAFGVEVGNSYHFDKTGKLVEQHAVGPKAFQKVLPLLRTP
jgi:hypothetical protein